MTFGRRFLFHLKWASRISISQLGTKGPLLRAGIIILRTNFHAHERLEEIWLNYMTYGNCEVVEKTTGSDVSDLIIPNPKHVAVGQEGAMGKLSYAYLPSSESEAKDIIAQKDGLFLVSALHNRLERERTNGKARLSLKPENVHHFYVPKFAHNLYGVPPLAPPHVQWTPPPFLREIAPTI